uniref:Receptor ligand binding region domain-containing protein n=1 Tax=Scleropages formosus TaxID=113540 RepID=A0A8C9QX74_SCLFO
MLYSIEQINNSTMLPNISLGYKIHDTCSDSPTAIRTVLGFMQDKNQPADNCSISIPCNFSTLEPRVKAVIGEESSEISTVVARLLAVYASTSQVLSDKSKYPSFLRTVSSDVHQAKAIVELIKTLSFHSIGLIGSDDEYGKYGIENIADGLENLTVCSAFKEILPSYFSQNDSQTQSELSEVIDKIKNSTAEAIVIFTKDLNVELILEEAARQNFSRTWIASDTWSTSTRIASMDGIRKIGRVFGFIWKTKKVDRWNCSFEVKKGEPEDDVDNDSGNDTVTCMDLGCFVQHVQMFTGEHYAIYLAVNAIAQGLRSLLRCDDVKCERNTDFYPWEVRFPASVFAVFSTKFWRAPNLLTRDFAHVVIFSIFMIADKLKNPGLQEQPERALSRPGVGHPYTWSTDKSIGGTYELKKPDFTNSSFGGTAYILYIFSF